MLQFTEARKADLEQKGPLLQACDPQLSTPSQPAVSLCFVLYYLFSLTICQLSSLFKHVLLLLPVSLVMSSRTSVVANFLLQVDFK